MTSPQVIVTAHALERARERFEPEFRGTPDRYVRGRIAREVRDAVAEQRVACRKPRWLVCTDRTRARWPSQRYAWTFNLHRCYVIDRRRGELVVVTTLAPLPGARP